LCCARTIDGILRNKDEVLTALMDEIFTADSVCVHCGFVYTGLVFAPAEEPLPDGGRRGIPLAFYDLDEGITRPAD
jgi:hypothetical protein